MNRRFERHLRCCSTSLLAAALVMACEIQLLASPPQSGQSGGTDRNGTTQLPDAPQPQTGQASPVAAQTPSGAAAAKAASPKGAPAAQPMGAAIAPVRQKGHRSLLIKIGLLAGAGVAIGSVVALSERSPTRPPGTTSSTHP